MIYVCTCPANRFRPAHFHPDRPIVDQMFRKVWIYFFQCQFPKISKSFKNSGFIFQCQFPIIYKSFKNSGFSFLASISKCFENSGFSFSVNFQKFPKVSKSSSLFFQCQFPIIPKSFKTSEFIFFSVNFQSFPKVSKSPD